MRRNKTERKMKFKLCCETDNVTCLINIINKVKPCDFCPQEHYDLKELGE